MLDQTCDYISKAFFFFIGWARGLDFFTLCDDITLFLFSYLVFLFKELFMIWINQSYFK